MDKSETILNCLSKAKEFASLLKEIVLNDQYNQDIKQAG